MAKSSRLYVSELSEEDLDLLAVAAFVAGQTDAGQAKVLLHEALQALRPTLEASVEYLAWKRNITPDEAWKAICTGELESLSAEDWAKMPKNEVSLFAEE